MPVGITVKGAATVGARTLVFIHGWPDTPEIFDRQVEHFEKEYRIVLLALPGYCGDKTPMFGHSFEDVATMLAASVREVMHGRSDKPLLVCHDWGAALTTLIMYREPTLFERVVMLDIGCHVGKQPLKAVIITVVYQWTLIFLCMLPLFLASPLTRLTARVLQAPRTSVAKAHGGMNYMYLRFWHRILTGNLPKPLAKFIMPDLPILFLYGAKKPFKFHSERFVKHLESKPGSGVAAFPSDHWFFARKRCAADVNAKIEGFFNSKL
jgi:cis-3-alkyl-4-acyloxetan-2-one decarboxylase